MRWTLFKERLRGKESWVIRRWVSGKYQRLPVGRYRGIRQDEEALTALVKRLNAPLDLKKKVSFQHAFINDALLSDYEGYLIGHIPKEAGARQELSYLKRYCLSYFIGELGLMDPADWFNASDTKWGAFLLSKRAPKSRKSKRDIVNAANRFVRWLHKLRPMEMPNKEFAPLTRNKLDEVERKRVAAGEARVQQLIPPEVVERICKRAPERIRSAVCLLARYGLRRNEALGVKPGDVKKGFLHIERQLGRVLGEYGDPKGKLPRGVPHWCASAADAYKWVEGVSKHPLHPRTFNAEWDELMEAMKLTYTPHDLRHTWITRMVRQHVLLDVSKAAGHKDVRITQRYLKDDRGLDDEEWKPTG